MTSRGLHRLRWYCQVCERQFRDANGFKCHVQSDSHIRQLEPITSNPHKAIERFSLDFQHEFLHLLRTAHGEKYVNANRFYGGEFIRDKAHTHMNATRWPSLTEFVKHLGREGLCLVREDEKDGLCIAWRNTSLAAIQRQQEIEKAEKDEARDCSDEKMLKRMQRRGREEAQARQTKLPIPAGAKSER